MHIWMFIVAVLGGVIGYFMKKKKAGRTKITSLASYKRRKRLARQEVPAGSSSQKCTYCKKTAKRITFYADEQGVISGVCPNCKQIAVRQDLTPL
ncbi:hypothetical protein [Paenibacillus sp. GCM10027626]|uniref:hypothetical protein n=1 Tax=Paenibacillus sp. GCM10027626 TaxID=3273411 RepID=UPI00363779F7